MTPHDRAYEAREKRRKIVKFILILTAIYGSVAACHAIWGKSGIGYWIVGVMAIFALIILYKTVEDVL